MASTTEDVLEAALKGGLYGGLGVAGTYGLYQLYKLLTEQEPPEEEPMLVPLGKSSMQKKADLGIATGLATGAAFPLGAYVTYKMIKDLVDTYYKSKQEALLKQLESQAIEKESCWRGYSEGFAERMTKRADTLQDIWNLITEVPGYITNIPELWALATGAALTGGGILGYEGLKYLFSPPKSEEEDFPEIRFVR